MKTQFKEVAHLYLGCKMVSPKGTGIWDLLPSDLPENWTDKSLDLFESKPILRPLSSMDKNQGFKTICRNYTRYQVEYVELGMERFMFYKLKYRTRWSPKKSCFFPVDPISPEAFAYLLSEHFDLFGLIESGQAIDATTLNPNPYDQ